MTFSINDVRLGACILEPSSPSAFRARFEDRPVPDQVDLRPYCTPVENQGRIGSCTANAAVGALEYHFIRRDGRSPDLSRMFVYYNSRQLQGDVFADAGATIPQAMASLLAFGACQEQVWPYDPALFSQRPSTQAYEDAKQHEAIHYARVDNGSRTIQALAEGLPVVFGTWLPGRCYEEAARTGVIPPPTDAERRAAPSGGHAMLIVGYDKLSQTFLVRNSWGEQWGDRGYCRIPFDMMEFFSPPDQFWVIGELEQSGSFTLVRPDMGAGATPSRLPEMKAGGMAESAARMREQIRSGLEADIGVANARVDSLLSGSSLRSPPKGSGSLRASVCNMCVGSGKCFCCGGTGYYTPGTDCIRCNGTGKCNACYGMGLIQ